MSFQAGRKDGLSNHPREKLAYSPGYGGGATNSKGEIPLLGTCRVKAKKTQWEVLLLSACAVESK